MLSHITMPSALPSTCSCCPYFDTFHGNCSHPSHQAILQDLLEQPEDCPVFEAVRADVMADLEERLGWE